MTPFLKQIAKIFYDKHGADIHRLAFVFPNRRSGIFFQKYLSEIATQPIFSPAIMTIDELFHKLSNKQQIDNIQLLFMLYDIYIEKSGTHETFDDFAYWGEMLLNDFDDVDKYLVDARQLFTNVTDLNNIEADFGYMQPEQIKAIRSFWSSFEPKKDDDNQLFFLHIWQILYPIYEELRKRLSEQNLAYEGMIYREVIENLKKNEINLEYGKIVFVGLNALTTSEHSLLKYLKNSGIADFYWDYSSKMLQDEDNRASFFMHDNITMFPSEYQLQEDNNEPATFEIIGIPSRIGQAKQLYPILKNMCGDLTMNAKTALQTAIVLPDEQMFIPVLNSIPEQIKRINVTLGYSLSGTPLASLTDYLQSLQKNARIIDGKSAFYHRDVIAILRHKYVASACPKEISRIIKEINDFNQIYVFADSLVCTPLLKLLFNTPANVADMSVYLMNVLKNLNEQLTISSSPKDDDDKECVVNSTELEQEFVYHFYTMIKRMNDIINKTKTEMTSDTYFRLLKQLTGIIKIPFRGEPLSGLQIMGVLETRALDFNNIIILSMNDGIFPSRTTANSFIPYHLRKGFGLPTQEHQESIWAYHFYRMINRAKHVIMLYDTRSDGLQSGEVSRYIYQLKYHYKVKIKESLSVYNISSSRINSIIATKDNEVMTALAAYEKSKELSASAINTYLDCPLKFYFSEIKNIKEEDAVNETLEYDTFGIIFHRVMELSYKRLCGTIVNADAIKFLTEEKNMEETIMQAFADDFFHSKELKSLVGLTYLNGEAIRKYACKILEYDKSLTPFEYICSEKKIIGNFEIGDGRKIRIKGFIDRIDNVNGTTRIVDYKSGKAHNMSFETTDSLFDITDKDRRKAIMQVFLYSMLYSKEIGTTHIQPAIYYTRESFKDNFDPSIYHIRDKEKTPVNDYSNFGKDFETSLQKCLNEMFDAGKPFTRTPNITNCEYCPFTEICSRQ